MLSRLTSCIEDSESVTKSKHVKSLSKALSKDQMTLGELDIYYSKITINSAQCLMMKNSEKSLYQRPKN
jgi:hypothetical protein